MTCRVAVVVVVEVVVRVGVLLLYNYTTRYIFNLFNIMDIWIYGYELRYCVGYIIDFHSTG